MKNTPTIITEKVYEGMPGEGYECGLQFIDESGNDYTQSGYFGKTPEQAFVRMLINEANGAVNLARGVIDEVEKLKAITQYLADKWNIDLMNLPSVNYTLEERFKASKISQVERENSLLRKALHFVINDTEGDASLILFKIKDLFASADSNLYEEIKRAS